jgi:hypothetical protein
MSLSDLSDQESDVRSKYGDQVFKSLVRLSRITRQMEMMGLFAFILLLSQLVLLIGLILSSKTSSGFWRYSDFDFLSSTAFITNITFLFLYERARRSGDTIFNEVSDELQWNLESEGIPSFQPSEPRGRPQLLVRIVLRSFIRNTDLPLTHGRSGAFLYLAFNFFLWAVLIFTHVVAIKPSGFG